MLAVAWIVVALFPVSEMTLALLRRARPGTASLQDQGSLRVLWLVITGSVLLAIILQPFAATQMHLPPRFHLVLAVCLIGAGLAIRWTAILTLGRLFTVNVAVQHGHSLVESGLYRHVRHPSYSGLLLAFLGLGVFFANWLGLVVLLVPITLAVANRIAKEEAVLGRAFGPAYQAYRARTKRLVPGLF